MKALETITNNEPAGEMMLYLTARVGADIGIDSKCRIEVKLSRRGFEGYISAHLTNGMSLAEISMIDQLSGAYH